MKQWLQAITAYETAAQEKKSAQHRRPSPNQPPVHTDLGAKIARACADLADFIKSSDFDTARRLLGASGRHIIIAEEYDGGGYGVVYFFDKEGFRKSTEAMGMWLAYASQDQIRALHVEPITNSVEIIHAAMAFGRMKPDEIVLWIRAELDRIATQALSQRK